MDDNLRQVYDEYGGRMDRELVEVAERLTERINEDPSLKSVILFSVISFVLLVFLIIFISLFLFVGTIFLLAYIIFKVISFFRGRANRN